MIGHTPCRFHFGRSPRKPNSPRQIIWTWRRTTMIKLRRARICASSVFPGLVMSVWSSAAADAMMLEAPWQRNIAVPLLFRYFQPVLTAASAPMTSSIIILAQQDRIWRCRPSVRSRGTPTIGRHSIELLYTSRSFLLHQRGNCSILKIRQPWYGRHDIRSSPLRLSHNYCSLHRGSSWSTGCRQGQ